MDTQKLQTGQQFIRTGQPIDNLWYINSGSVQAAFDGGAFTLPKGSLIGISDFAMDSHFFSYTALEDTQLLSFGNKSMFHNADFFSGHPDNTTHLALNMNVQMLGVLSQYENVRQQCDSFYHFLADSYEQYRTICNEFHVVAKDLPSLSELAPLSLEHDIGSWLSDYHKGMKSLFLDPQIRTRLESASILPGYLYQSSEELHQVMEVCVTMQDYCNDLAAILLNEDSIDFFDLLTNLFYCIGAQNAQKMGLGSLIKKSILTISSQPSIPKTLLQTRLDEYKNRIRSMEQLRQLASGAQTGSTSVLPAAAHDLSNSVRIIMEYAECLPEIAESFRMHLEEYKQLKNKNSDAPDASKLRKDLTSEFYAIYISAFQNSLFDENIPSILKMFFQFGFVDADLAGQENTCYLYSIVDTYHDLPKKGIYTMYHWLRAIYNGEKSPSITELESSYEKYVQELVSLNKIDQKMAEKMLHDNAQKTMFELNNLFPSVCKITNGHLATYCPILSEHQFVRRPEDILLQAEAIQQNLDQLCTVDYGLFYHDSLTVLCQSENIHDYFHVEIRPDIILTPLVGTRSAMWQAYSGRSQLSPARMMLPIFDLENLQKGIIHMSAEYRWEICKRVQGSHWNDVTEPSLTSLYYDYLQFYKKNSDLSSDAKEKIRSDLSKYKQNFREYFIHDYQIYILSESNASPRLNKVARSILFSQCPFSAAIRDTLSANPLYTDPLHRNYIHCAQRLHQLNNLKVKLENLKQPVSQLLYDEIDYWKK